MAFLAATRGLFFVFVRLLILSHPGFCFVYQYTLFKVLFALRVYRVVHQLISELDLVILGLPSETMCCVVSKKD